MASFEQHINQARANFAFLKEVNAKITAQWDWQVTICFYSAVHLINAHIVCKSNQHYRSHEQVNNAISPFTHISLCKLSENIFLAYMKLQNLSRRSRYLCSDNPREFDVRAFHTSEKHFAKAIRELNILLEYFDKEYSLGFTQIAINCPRIKEDTLQFFTHSSTPDGIDAMSA